MKKLKNIHFKLKYYNFRLIFFIISLTLLGIIVIGSAAPGQNYQMKQLIGMILGAIIMLALSVIDYRFLLNLHWIEYGVCVFLLILVLIPGVGKNVKGAQRWIPIGSDSGINIQPSEFAKLIMIICLARLLSTNHTGFKTWKSLIPVAGMMFLPTILIFIQPDLGTSLVFAAIAFGMLYICGLRMELVKRALIALVVMFPVIWFFVLNSYQKMRILVLFNPSVDPYGSGYHVIQSKISIGSGGFLGQGLFEGTQSQLNFLPENHTDFIFSVIGEELGFIGAIFVIFLYFVLLYRTIMISRSSGDSFGSLLACGIFSMWLFQVFINVGMTLGIMPVTGIPLPFMSYGGSALVMNLLCVGILMNIYLRRKKLMID